MKALVYTAPYTLEYREEPDPVPGPGEVLVAVESVGICGSDMHGYHGQDARRPAPLILGHEAAGRIVTGPRTGERVALNPLVIDPSCHYAKEGRGHLSPTREILSMPARPGAFAELVRIPSENALAIADATSYAHAALVEPMAVSWHAVGRGIHLLHGSIRQAHVVILGGGAIGVTAALAARHFGARSVTIGETNELRRRRLQEAEGLSCYEPGGPEEPGENSADLVIDAVGAVATRRAACRMARPGAVIVHIGLLPGHDGLDIRKITLQEVTVTGTYCYSPEEFRASLAAIEAGQLGPMTWFETRPLADGAQAFADIDGGRAVHPKIVLETGTA